MRKQPMLAVALGVALAAQVAAIHGKVPARHLEAISRRGQRHPALERAVRAVCLSRRPVVRFLHLWTGLSVGDGFQNVSNGTERG